MRKSLYASSVASATALVCAGVLLVSCGVREAAAPARVQAADPQATPQTAYNLYVAPNGADTNPGTEALPFKTIARAAQAALPGTAVHVAPGTYSGGFRTNASGTAKDRIYYVSTQKWGAKIVPPLNSPNSTAWDNRGNYVDIVGFDVDGTVFQGGVKWTNGIYNGGSYDVIRNNHVHHIATTVACTSAGGSGIGIDSYYRGLNSQVLGNVVHDIGPAGCSFIQGIYVNTPGLVKNNVVYRVSEAGIHLWHDATSVVVANNTISASNSGIVVGGGDFYHTSGPNDNTHVVNNIVYDNKLGITEHGATGKNNTYRNNLVFQNPAGDWRLLNGLTHKDTVAAAPEFLAYSRTGTPDFRLSSSSPAIGKGSPTHAHPSDMRGAPRGGSNGYDIGAYQH